MYYYYDALNCTLLIVKLLLNVTAFTVILFMFILPRVYIYQYIYLSTIYIIARIKCLCNTQGPI